MFSFVLIWNLFLLGLDFKFNNPLGLCLEDYYEKSKCKPSDCKNYDPDRLEDSGYISEECGLTLCAGWADLYIPPNLIGCSKDKLKKRITFRRKPYYKDKRFSIKDKFEVLPKGLYIQHRVEPLGYLILLKDGYKIEDIPSNNDVRMIKRYLYDKVDLSKPLYIKVRNISESKETRRRCEEILINYATAKAQMKNEDGIMIPGMFDEKEREDCHMIPIINEIFEKGSYDICRGIDGKTGVDVWINEFNRVKDKTKGYLVNTDENYFFCVTGEYEFSIQYLDWYK